MPGPTGSNDIWGVAGTAEHRFTGAPISVFVRGEYENAFDDLFETIIVSGGIRVLIDNGMTLEDHDRNVPFDVKYPRIFDSPFLQTVIGAGEGPE